jgi:GNAT superfamily N-acetyltransferase
MAGQWRVERRGANDPEVEAIVAGYLAELHLAMPDFDAGQASPPGPDDFEWPNGSFVVVFAGDESVACGAVRRLSPGVGELRRMSVKSDWRGQGLGRLLLEELEEVARDLAVSELRLDTKRALGPAVALYRSAGYRDVAPYNDNDFADLWMAKEL